VARVEGLLLEFISTNAAALTALAASKRGLIAPPVGQLVQFGRRFLLADGGDNGTG
jgi:hypothetical protein